MSTANVTFVDGVADMDDVADRVVDAWAEQNHGVAEVIPADEIESQLEAAVVDADGLSDDAWHDLLLDAKSAVTDRDVVVV